MSSINTHCEYISSFILKIIFLCYHFFSIRVSFAIDPEMTSDVVLFRNFNQIYIYDNVCCGLSLLTYGYEKLMILAL